MKVWSLIAEQLAKQQEPNSCCALVTMTEVLGSAPRETGARMVIRPDGGFHGTIGGGTLEWRALADAQKLMKNGLAQINFSTHALGPELGQCCGGVVKLLIEVFTQEQLAEVIELADQEKAVPFKTIGYVTDDRVYREIKSPEDQSCLTTSGGPFGTNVTIDTNGDLLECFGEQRRAVYLYGAGHVGRALMLSMATLSFDLTWVDNRAEALPSVVPGSVNKVFTQSPVSTLEDAPDGAFVVIMTHSHALDLDLVNAALAANRFDYVGVIGSATKKARFRNRLKSAGLEAEVIDKLVCPIGIEGIKSKHPAVIAASVIAELLVRDEEISAKADLINQNDDKSLDPVLKFVKKN